MRIIWATPQMARFFLPRHIESFCRKMLFNSCIFLKHLARHGNTHVEPKKCRDLGQPCFYQPIFNKFWAEEYITYDGIRLQVSFWIFWWQKWLNLMFSGDSWGIWITWFGKDYTIHFLEKTLFIFGPPFLNHFLVIFREQFLLFLWWHYRSFSRPKVVNCTLMHLFVQKMHVQNIHAPL